MDIPIWLGLPITVLLGLVYGSFATALIHRVPAGIGWGLFPAKEKNGETSMPRSACPQCGHRLGVFDLVPFFSWLALRGRCRYCKASIGWQYPLTELMTMAGCIGIYGSWGFGLPALILMATVPMLVALAAIDLKYMILPNILNVSLTVLWVAFMAAGWGMGYGIEPVLWGALYGLESGLLFAVVAFCLSWVMKKILSKEALGFGDVKFFGVAGLWLGYEMLPVFLMLTGILGVLIGLLYRILKKEAYFPFGPSLICSFYLLILCAKPLF